MKSFNEDWNWKDILHPDKAFVRKAKAYLDQFKKGYEERSKSENIIVECLYNIEVMTKNPRYLGAAEGVLLMEGFLDSPGSKFDYQEKEHKFLFMKFKTTETYEELIIRKCKDFLKSRGVL